MTPHSAAMTTGTYHQIADQALLRRIAARIGSRFNVTMAIILATLTLAEILLARRVHLGATGQLLGAWPGFLLVVGSLVYCKRRPLPRLIDPCELIVWAVLSSNVLALMIQLAARSPYPLVDTQLAALDHSMHFETASIVALVSRLPIVQEMLALAYAAIPLLVFAAILIPPFFGQRLASRRYILSVIVTTVFTSILFALWPACGPWASEGFRPSAEQAAITTRLLLLKSAPIANLDLEHTAIVSFPSFHVVLAILSAIALNGVPRIRLFVWVLALLTCVSTITTGWHYGFDLLGGLAVTASGWSIARLVLSLEIEPGTVPRFEVSPPPLMIQSERPLAVADDSCRDKLTAITLP